MDAPQTTRARERCEVHPDRTAVGRCQSCGRTVCLDCAIPFRGGIRCERCAAIELGEPAPQPAAPRRRVGIRPFLPVLLLAAGGGTIPPWHRSGTLTTQLSAWTLGLEPYAAVACSALAVAFALSLVAAFRPARRWLAGVALFSAVSAGGVALTLGDAPAFFSSTVAPLVTLTGTAAAAVLALFSLVRRARP